MNEMHDEINTLNLDNLIHLALETTYTRLSYIKKSSSTATPGKHCCICGDYLRQIIFRLPTMKDVS